MGRFFFVCRKVCLYWPYRRQAFSYSFIHRLECERVSSVEN